jgi:hypothetical protein
MPVPTTTSDLSNVIEKVMIDILPDNVLLEIFHFYKGDPISIEPFAWPWITLVHVSRRWRHTIFGSPRGLDLRLVCSERTPARRSLDMWPPFPIIILSNINQTVDDKCVENVIAALERRERIYSILIQYGHGVTRSIYEKSTTVMLGPFPV